MRLVEKRCGGDDGDRKGSAVSSRRYYLYVGAFRFGLVTIAENSKKNKGDFHNDCKHRRCSLAFGSGFRPSTSIPAFVPQVSQAWHFPPNVLVPSTQFNSIQFMLSHLIAIQRLALAETMVNVIEHAATWPDSEEHNCSPTRIVTYISYFCYG